MKDFGIYKVDDIEFPEDISINEWKRLKKMEDLNKVIIELHKKAKPDTQMNESGMGEILGYRQAKMVLEVYDLL